MAIRKSSNSGIPFGNTASRPASPATGQPYFNGEIGRLELYSSNGWQNIVQETPGVASASGTYNESAGSGTFTVSGTNFVDGAIAYAVGTNGTEYQATTTTYNSIVQLTTVFSNLSPAYEPYDIKITNPSNLFGLLPDAFYINDSPVWSTSSGSLGSYAYNSSVSTQLAATDDESNSITYSVTSGSLPSGLSLSSGGLISGTIAANPATYTFTISASDGVNTAVTRSFSIIVPAPVVTGGTLSSDSTYYYRTFTGSGTLSVSDSPLNANVLIVGGGGGGANGNGSPGGGGAGGVVSLSNYLLSTQSHTITVGAGATQNAAANDLSGNRGSNSSLNSVLALGGGGGIGWGGVRTNADSAGSGGGGSGNNQSGGSTAQSSQNSGVSGLTQYGNIGGNSGTWGAYGGGGGGGAGAAGGNSTTSNSGSGGVGTALFSSWGLTTSTGQNVGGTVYYAGGGGGGHEDSAGPAGPAGSGGYGGGGAGRGRSEGTLSGVSGTINTGGGGGSGGWTSSGGRPGGAGGSGIIIVRYTKASVGG